MARPIDKRRYPHFHRALRRRGPYFRGEVVAFRKRALPRTIPFAWIVAASAALMFASTYLLLDRHNAAWASGLLRTFTYYPNCDFARAAGTAPLNRDEPGYRSGLDADDDGEACEPIPD